RAGGHEHWSDPARGLARAGAGRAFRFQNLTDPYFCSWCYRCCERTGIRRCRAESRRVARVRRRCHCALARRYRRPGGHEGISGTAKATVDRKTGKDRDARADGAKRRQMIRKVLIANRGEIAVRISCTLREMDIQTVAVFTEPDQHALHVQSAHEARAISSYLDASEIVRTAKESGADAIHPGYGFLAENGDFSEACQANVLIFIRPRPDTIRAMGDKLQSKHVMQQASIPIIPVWNGSPPPSEFPVLVKAVGGGGGKGMRLVQNAAELQEALASASREASAAFGDHRV